MTTWTTLQSEVSTWARHNFGDQPASQPALGLVEEVGEFVASREQWRNARGKTATDQFKMEMVDALADQTIYVLNLCQICGVFFDGDIVALNISEALSDAQIIGALAACSHAVLKFEQGIRGVDFNNRREKLIVALSLWYRWASYQCFTFNLPTLLQSTENVWSEVRRRDWRKNPTNANQIAASEKQEGTLP